LKHVVEVALPNPFDERSPFTAAVGEHRAVWILRVSDDDQVAV